VMLMMVTRPDPRLPEIVSAAVAGGVNIVQVRGSDDAPIRAAVGDRARIVVNALSGVAQASSLRPSGLPGRRLEACATPGMPGIPGIHLPEDADFVPAAYVGRSVHSVDAAVRAQEEGCDYIVAGTIFPSASHPNGPVAGLALIEEIAKHVTIPVIAIGGITPANARACVDAGAGGVAVLSYLMDAADPRAAAQTLWSAIHAVIPSVARDLGARVAR